MIKTFTCKQCSKQFDRRVYPSRNIYEYCSTKCRNKARALGTVKCLVCNTKFVPYKINGADKKRKRYCSTQCANYAKRGAPSTNPKTHSKEEILFIKEYYPIIGAGRIAEKLGYTKSAISNLAHRLGIVLNKDSYYTIVHGAAKTYMTGENNPNWAGGKTCTEWGKNWKQQQKKARQRDGYTCQVCGHYSKFISVHHIKPRRLFIGRMEEANVLSNLICLCNKHHVPVELGKILCPKPKR